MRFAPSALQSALATASAAFMVLSFVASASSAPNLADVAATLRARVPALPEPAPGITNVDDYLASLAPRVLAGRHVPSPGPLISRTNEFPERIGYLRLAEVSAGLSDAVGGALAHLSRSGPLKGMILDLRFAGGTNLAAAAETAGRFAARDNDSIRLGTEPWRISARAMSNVPPVAVLVNRQSREAAEALAVGLRSAAVPSIVIGTNTAGQAHAYEPFVVTPELSVRIAVSDLRLPDRGPVAASGIQPDIIVRVAENEELEFMAGDPSRAPRSAQPRAAGRVRLTEADLVRSRRGPRSRDVFPPDDRSPRSREGEIGGAGSPGTVQDPVLARALDILGGFAAERANVAPGDSR